MEYFDLERELKNLINPQELKGPKHYPKQLTRC